RPTTHSDPTFFVEGSLYYCVANMPGAVPHTSTYALANVTMPYALEIADNGLASAIARDPALALGVNVVGGKIVYEAVANAHGLPCVPITAVRGEIP
ncbi:MAG: alanine dehydrogenase, partial [Acidimicrobiales bacterium]